MWGFVLSFAALTPLAAGTFMVCSGTEFTLTAGGSGYTAYEWSLGGSVVGTSAGLTATHTLPPESAGAAETRVYSLRAQDATGCWSDLATHTVYILPVPTVSITDPISLYCANENVMTTLTANAGATSNMPAGIAYTYTWTGGGTPAGNTLAVTAAGTYQVSVAYDFTNVTLDGAKAACTGTDSHTITPATAPAAPSVTIN